METARITENLLARTYGDRVTLEYADAADPGVLERYADLLATVPPARQFYPMVFVNGKLGLVGSADFYDVLYAIRETAAQPTTA